MGVLMRGGKTPLLEAFSNFRARFPCFIAAWPTTNSLGRDELDRSEFGKFFDREQDLERLAAKLKASPRAASLIDMVQDLVVLLFACDCSHFRPFSDYCERRRSLPYRRGLIP